MGGLWGLFRCAAASGHESGSDVRVQAQQYNRGLQASAQVAAAAASLAKLAAASWGRRLIDCLSPVGRASAHITCTAARALKCQLAAASITCASGTPGELARSRDDSTCRPRAPQAACRCAAAAGCRCRRHSRPPPWPPPRMACLITIAHAASPARRYEADGFTHLSDDPQLLLTVANMFYTDSPGDWIVLVLDPAKLTAEVRATGGASLNTACRPTACLEGSPFPFTPPLLPSRCRPRRGHPSPVHAAGPRRCRSSLSPRRRWGKSPPRGLQGSAFSRTSTAQSTAGRWWRRWPCSAAATAPSWAFPGCCRE